MLAACARRGAAFSLVGSSLSPALAARGRRGERRQRRERRTPLRWRPADIGERAVDARERLLPDENGART
ncbi:MAG TPA: hypothetical protein VNM67_10495 [Thermoanaerobaculia bacterium]|nr:hypothetical protein [Thermoanaerobaculia bacterium]